MEFYLSAGPTEGLGKIIQRFPQKDWEDTPFPQGIELVSLHYILQFLELLSRAVGRYICLHVMICII